MGTFSKDFELIQKKNWRTVVCKLMEREGWRWIVTPAAVVPARYDPQYQLQSSWKLKGPDVWGLGLYLVCRQRAQTAWLRPPPRPRPRARRGTEGGAGAGAGPPCCCSRRSDGPRSSPASPEIFFAKSRNIFPAVFPLYLHQLEASPDGRGGVRGEPGGECLVPE